MQVCLTRDEDKLTKLVGTHILKNTQMYSVIYSFSFVHLF